MICPFNEAWRGRCGKPADVSGYCDYHRDAKCWCGTQATHNCDVAVSLVCGAPLCDEHECAYIGAGFTGFGAHSTKGRAQYEAFLAEAL